MSSPMVGNVVSNAHKDSFHRSLPTKRMASGCVLRNAAGQILIVKPIYKEYWDLPGGVVEDNESLWEACRREVNEELGIDLVSGSLLCVDYCSTQPGYVESLQVLFDCGVAGIDLIESIELDREELSDLRWVKVDEAARLLGSRVSRRLQAVESLLGTGRGVYLEDQTPV